MSAAEQQGGASMEGCGLLARVRLGYRAMWVPTRNLVSAYCAVARVPLSDVGEAWGDAELAVGNDAEASVALDMIVARGVVADLAKIVAAGRQVFIVLSLHFETLGVKAHRRRFLEILEGLPATARKILFIEVADLPQGMRKERLLDLLHPLRASCRMLILRVPLETSDMRQLLDCGIGVVSCNIFSHPGPEALLMKQLDTFQAAAQRVKFSAFLRGSRSLSPAAIVTGMGFAFIEGDAIAPITGCAGRDQGHGVERYLRRFARAQRREGAERMTPFVHEVNGAWRRSIPGSICTLLVQPCPIFVRANGRPHTLPAIEAGRLLAWRLRAGSEGFGRLPYVQTHAVGARRPRRVAEARARGRALRGALDLRRRARRHGPLRRGRDQRR